MGAIYDVLLGRLRTDEGGGGGGSHAIAAPPPACTGLGIVLGNGQVELTWTDPSDLDINGWEAAKWARTVAVVKSGGFPTDVTDGVIVLATSRDPEHDAFPLPTGVTYGYKDAYRMSSGTVVVADVDAACIKLFSCSTEGVWNCLAANEYPSYTDYSWGQLADYADAGTFLSHVPIGSTLDMDNTDYPGHEWLVMGEDCFVAKNPAAGHHIGLLSRYVLFTAPCDAPETQWALTEDAAAVTGVKYAISVGGVMTEMTEGTDWDEGDTSATYDGVTYPIADWYEKNPNGSYNYGSNFTPQRNDVQWMNAEGGPNEWFVKQNIWDACGSTLKGYAGFLKNMDADFKACLVECTRTCYNYTSFRIRGRGASSTFDAKVFPLNLYEIFGTAQGGITEGRKVLDYFTDGGSKVAYLSDKVTASTWWSASAHTSNASSASYVSSTGTSSSSHACNAFGYRPACAFGKQVSQ